MGQTLNNLPKNPRRKGYTFAGWFKTKSGFWSRQDEYPYKDQASLNDSTVWEWNRDITFEARWVPDTFQLTWDANGGRLDELGNQSIVVVDAPFNTVIGGAQSSDGTYCYNVVPTREGYVFLGWFDDPVVGNQVNPYGTVEANATYYAHWEPETYSISYDLGGHGTLPEAAPISYNVTQLPMTIPEPEETPTHRFSGWTPSSGIPEGTTGDQEFAARWE